MKTAAIGTMGVASGFFMFRHLSRLSQRYLFPKHRAHLVKDFIEPEKVELEFPKTEMMNDKAYYHINVKWHFKRPDGSIDKAEWTVKKRFSDFDILYQSFRSFDPDNRIPQPNGRFPQKDYNNTRLQVSTPTDEYLENRKQLLKDWLCGYEEICQTNDGVAIEEKKTLRHALAGFYSANNFVGRDTDIFKELKKQEAEAKKSWFGAKEPEQA